VSMWALGKRVVSMLGSLRKKSDEVGVSLLV